MQLLKLAMARQLSSEELPDVDTLIRAFDLDVFRTVDRLGTDSVTPGWIRRTPRRSG